VSLVPQSRVWQVEGSAPAAHSSSKVQGRDSSLPAKGQSRVGLPLASWLVDASTQPESVCESV
jgi:hypothetical protein